MSDAASIANLGVHREQLDKTGLAGGSDASLALSDFVNTTLVADAGKAHTAKVGFVQPHSAAERTATAEAQPVPDGPPGVLDSLKGVPFSEVTVEGKVLKILPDNPNGLTHEQFVVALPDGTDVFVAHDLSMAPRVPLTVGEPIEMKGEWIPEPENHGGVNTIGVVHWTHHTDTPKHPGGWIQAGGQTYQ